jgi:hypothetical protein
VIELAANSDFLAGQNQNSWIADFNWIMRPGNFVKVLEGKYKNKSSGKNSHNKNWREKQEEEQNQIKINLLKRLENASKQTGNQNGQDSGSFEEIPQEQRVF